MSYFISELTADTLVKSWMAAWNAHDVDQIVAHYHADVEYHSPFIAQLAGKAGTLHGRTVLREYVTAALERYPTLHFDPPSMVAAGDGSIAFVYRSVNDRLAIETLVVDQLGRIVRAHCHYRDTGNSD
jgi:ketosteroid isomerase-like protein